MGTLRGFTSNMKLEAGRTHSSRHAHFRASCFERLPAKLDRSLSQGSAEFGCCMCIKGWQDLVTFDIVGLASPHCPLFRSIVGRGKRV